MKTRRLLSGPWRAPLLLLGTAALLYFLFLLFPAFMDRVYSSIIYRYAAQGLSFVAALLPFSLAELALYGAAFLLLYGLGRLLFCALCRRRSFGAEFRRLGGRLLRGCLWLLGIFMLTCGLNYHRLPLAVHVGYAPAPAPVESLTALNHCLLDRLHGLQGHLRHRADGSTRMDQSFDSYKKHVAQAYDSLGRSLREVRGRFPATKAFLASPLMSYCQVMGFYFPWTVEATINNHVPDFWIPALMAHEQAHVRGFMREDEANFLVFLVGSSSGDAELAYSCLLHTFVQSSRALYRADARAYRRLMEGLGPHLQADLEANRRYWEPFRTRWGEVSSQVNNAYLKANRQTDGVASYGRVVDLLLAHYLRNPEWWEASSGMGFEHNSLELKAVQD